MRRQLLPGLGLLGFLTIATGVLYPLAVLGVAQGAFGDQANGSLVRRDGRVAGSRLLAQQFTGARYFHPRPSAAGLHGYDATASGASNLGPLDPRLARAVRDRAAAYRRENHLARGAPVPVDAVTASASGLDPDVSPANGRLQAPRVAAARGLPLPRVLALVDAHVDDRQLGFLGEKTVNVLDLDLALDRLR